MHESHQKSRRFIIILLVLLLIFASIFIIAYVNLQKKQHTFGLEGMPSEVEDWMIMILSLASMIKIVWELIVFKSKDQQTGQ